MKNCGRFAFYNNIFFYEQAKQPAVSDMLRYFQGLYKGGHGLYPVDHSSRPISARGFAQLL